MHRFSIIIPLRDDRRLFDDTLASVLRYQPEASQVIVVHDGTYDDPYEIRDEVDFAVAARQGGLIRFFNSALNEATGQIVALIRPGILLDEGWSQPIETAFEDSQIASVAPAIVTTGQPNVMVAAGVKDGLGFRRKIVGAKTKIDSRSIQKIKPLGPTTWAAFYRKQALDQIGICGEEMHSHYLDLDIALSLQSIGYRSEFCPDSVVSIEDAKPIVDELVKPHGRSAQRGFRRHGTHTSRAQFLAVLAREILASPFQPWLIQHAFERFGAYQMATLDRHYAELISILARQRRHTGGKTSPGHEPDQNQIDLNRRAA